MLHLMSVLNFDNAQMVGSLLHSSSLRGNARQICACGGLLAYLFKNKIIHQLEDASDPISVRSIQNIPT
jgi:hypothetical protein